VSEAQFLTPEGAEEYQQIPIEEPGASASDFSSPLAGEVSDSRIFTTHIDTIHLSFGGYLRSCVVECLSAAKENAKKGDYSIVRSGPWAFEVQRIGARPFFDFLLKSPYASIKVNQRGGNTVAFAEVRSKALAALGPHSIGREIQLMVSRWLEGQQGALTPARVGRIDYAATFRWDLLGLEGHEIGRFVTRSEARNTYRVAEPISWPRCELSDLARARAIKAIESATTIQEARAGVFRALAAPGCRMETTFEGVSEEHLLDTIYARGRKFSGYSFAMGADVSARIYDKGMEAAKRRTQWVLTWLKGAGWTGAEPVHRFEVQLRTAAIKKYVTQNQSLSGRELGAVLDGSDGIWSAITGRDGAEGGGGWLTYRIPNGNPQPTRWAIHPGWEAIQNARWYANRPHARTFNRDYIPAALKPGFRRSAPIQTAAAALQRGPMHAQALKNQYQISRQIQGLLAAHVAAGIVTGETEEPTNRTDAADALLEAARSIIDTAENPLGKIEHSRDMKYWRAAHQLLE